MKLIEIAKQDFFGHGSPEHTQYMKELDAYTASPNTRLKKNIVEFLRSKYKDQSSSLVLYRAMMFNSLEEMTKVLGASKVGSTITYKRDKESSWTKSKSFAYRFADEADADEQYLVVLKASIPRKNFLLDISDLSKNDLEEIYIDQRQEEVIVDEQAVEAVIDKIEDRFE